MTAEEKLPGHDQQPENITCESCGRFVGALAKCPHCGARVHARMSVRFFRLTAILLSTVGLFFLYKMAVNRETPVISISSIQPTMNFGFVRLAGKVSASPSIKYEAEILKSVKFNINDGTGEIAVTAFGNKGQELLDSGKLPIVGDRVDVSGSLSLSAEFNSLVMQTPAQMLIERGEVLPMQLGEITDSNMFSTVIIVAEITEVRPPRIGKRVPWTVQVEDGTGKRDVTFWQDIYDAIPDKTRLAPGQKIRAQVAVSSFRKKIQLQLGEVESLEFLESGSKD